MCIRDRRYDHCLFVFLDDGTIAADASVRKTVVLPGFGGFLERLRPLYAHFNTARSINGLEETPKSPQRTTESRNLCYKPKSSDIDVAVNILEAFRHTLEENVIALLPKQAPFSDEHPTMFNGEKLLAAMLGRNADEKVFLTRFVRTQLFTCFLEEYFELSQ
eukprot:TRINITY_DN9966_c0_g1_i10.p1 TRINITY_DN9966_c0_g1~~TRINITY_DN9966_c0_g1_i10.p1  ORF type:complete len:162 (+),score=35.74 TRINITY_DN9966_c0_g1_i10:65-550(+)